MTSPLDQIGSLTANPSGLPGSSVQEQEIAALQDEIEYQKELAEQQRFAYGVASAQQQRNVLPDERQLRYIFDVRQTPDELSLPPVSFEELVQMVEKHIQLSQGTGPEHQDWWREWEDIKIEMQQYGNEEVAYWDLHSLYLKILASKGQIHGAEQGQPAIVSLLAPTNRTEIKQTQVPYDANRKPGGFFGFLKGRS